MKKKILLSIMVIIFVSLIFFYSCLYIKTKNNEKRLLEIANEVVDFETRIEMYKENKIEEVREKTFDKEKISLNESILGILKIPRINLEAPVMEGTTQDILKYSVGHFTESSFWDKNIALAAHNSGMYSHYFRRINELNREDKIIYKTKFGEKTYKVFQIEIIDSTDWSYVLSTEANIITLITCIKNKDDQRLCVIGKCI